MLKIENFLPTPLNISICSTRVSIYFLITFKSPNCLYQSTVHVKKNRWKKLFNFPLSSHSKDGDLGLLVHLYTLFKIGHVPFDDLCQFVLIRVLLLWFGDLNATKNWMGIEVSKAVMYGDCEWKIFLSIVWAPFYFKNAFLKKKEKIVF